MKNNFDTWISSNGLRERGNSFGFRLGFFIYNSFKSLKILIMILISDNQFQLIKVSFYSDWLNKKRLKSLRNQPI